MHVIQYSGLDKANTLKRQELNPAGPGLKRFSVALH